MQEITDEMLVFKEAIRHSWNTYFTSCDSPMSPEIQDAFEKVEHGLLQVIVLAPLGISDRADEYRRKPLSWLVVQPSDGVRECPLQFGEVDGAGNTRWSVPIVLSTEGNVVFEFFDFFDWYPYGSIDLPYVRVLVRDLPSKPEAQGLMALIEQRHCRFLLKA